MEVKFVRNRLRWLGHVSRMEDERPVKVLLFGELNDGKRPFGRPKIRYKYTSRCALRRCDVIKDWRSRVDNQRGWEKLTWEKCKRSVEKLRRNIKAKDRKGKEVVDVKFVFLWGGGELLPLAPVLYNN